jgi:hypothetical protein
MNTEEIITELQRIKAAHENLDNTEVLKILELVIISRANNG